MSTAIERCPHCPASILWERTNGNGLAYLECTDCGYIDAVIRRADPNPTIRYTRSDGRVVPHRPDYNGTKAPLTPARLEAQRQCGKKGAAVTNAKRRQRVA